MKNQDKNTKKVMAVIAVISLVALQISPSGFAAVNTHEIKGAGEISGTSVKPALGKDATKAETVSVSKVVSSLEFLQKTGVLEKVQTDTKCNVKGGCSPVAVPDKITNPDKVTKVPAVDVSALFPDKKKERVVQSQETKCTAKGGCTRPSVVPDKITNPDKVIRMGTVSEEAATALSLAKILDQARGILGAGVKSVYQTSSKTPEYLFFDAAGNRIGRLVQPIRDHDQWYNAQGMPVYAVSAALFAQAQSILGPGVVSGYQTSSKTPEYLFFDAAGNQIGRLVQPIRDHDQWYNAQGMLVTFDGK